MKSLKLNGNITVFPGTQIVCRTEDGLEVYPKWGELHIGEKISKVWCNKNTFRFYRTWFPVTIIAEKGFYGGLSNGATLIVYAKEYTPIVFEDESKFYEAYKAVVTEKNSR